MDAASIQDHLQTGESRSTSVPAAQDQYNQNFVDRWDSMINWDARAAGEKGFFSDYLKSVKARRVLDVAGGTGYHAIQLAKAGFDVTMVDISSRMISKARENAKLHQVDIQMKRCDWLDLPHSMSGQFDAIVCLGSSYPHLLQKKDRRVALGNFKNMLEDGGSLILDHRNFDAIRLGNYSNPNNLYYCGGGVDITPSVENDVCTFSYRFGDGKTHQLHVSALRSYEVVAEIEHVGFSGVSTFGDFSRDFSINDVGFLLHIARRQSQEIIL